jgi:hypothetical protein
MSEENYKVQWSVSLPPAAQYAKGDMLNIRGESVAEVEGLLERALSGDFINKAAEVAALVRAAAVVTDTFTPTQDAAPQQVQPQQTQQQAPAGPVYTCVHGKRTERTGTNARGAWTGYFCPLKKGDPNQCEVVWGD